EPTQLEIVFDRLTALVVGTRPPRGPLHQAGAPDDTLENHQADMDKATDGWNYVRNPLKYPLEIQRVVNDKIDRILEYRPPEEGWRRQEVRMRVVLTIGGILVSMNALAQTVAPRPAAPAPLPSPTPLAPLPSPTPPAPAPAPAASRGYDDAVVRARTLLK